MITFWKSAEIRPSDPLATALEFLDLHRAAEEIEVVAGIKPRLREDGDTMYLEVDAPLNEDGFLDEERSGDVIRAVEIMSRTPKGVYADVDTKEERETAPLFRPDPFDLSKPLNIEYREEASSVRCANPACCATGLSEDDLSDADKDYVHDEL